SACGRCSFTDHDKENSINKINLWSVKKHRPNEERKIAIIIKDKIEKTDKEIDKMVYELYRLPEEEIKIVENKQ
ncbi:MAG: hypothetical protein ABIT08_02980, partial [Bacteroidia bacterium]